MACLFHKWNGCTCSKCGKTRDKKHGWNGCKCTVCDKLRDEGHNYNAIPNKCEEKCTICGKILPIPHKIQDNICSVCGNTLENIKAEYETAVKQFDKNQSNADIFSAIQLMSRKYAGVGDPQGMYDLCNAYADTMINACGDYWAISKSYVLHEFVKADPVERFLAVRSNDTRFNINAGGGYTNTSPGTLNPKSESYYNLLDKFSHSEAIEKYKRAPQIAFFDNNDDYGLIKRIADADKKQTRALLYETAVSWVEEAMKK